MEKTFMVLLRLSLGWYMFFAGIEKVLDPGWTAAGFLGHAQTFPGFYAWFALPQNLVWVDPLNAWGITLVAGALLMILYYFPHNAFPAVPHGFIVEEHIINAIGFLLIAYSKKAQHFGIAGVLKRSPLGSVPLLKNIL